MALKAPRGTQDILENEVYQWQKLESILRNFCRLYNFDEIRTPIFEDTAVFSRENDSSDMVNKEMYTFSPKGSSDSLTLRPEGTAGVIRSYVENKKYASPDLPVRYFYMGPMHRHERPQKGRLRIFNQFGVESLGLKNPWIDAETILLGYSILKALGIENVRVLINTLGDEQTRNSYRKALEDHFRDHVDELCVDCQRRYRQNPLRILDCKIDGDSEIVKNAPDIHESLSPEAKAYFEQVLSLLDRFEVPYTVEKNLVRGLDYYTDTVFEMISDRNDLGSLTLLAGGRYDHLVEEMGGPSQSGIGFATGMERLLLALRDQGIILDEKPPLDVYVIVLGKEARDFAFEVAAICRANGFRTDMDLNERSLKAQFKASDRAGARVLLMIGKKEAEEGKVTLKIPGQKEQTTVSLDELVPALHAFLLKKDLSNEQN